MRDLTDRQQAVLQLADRGLDNPAIAEELRVSLSTVLSHWSTLYSVLSIEKGAHRRERAIVAWTVSGAQTPRDAEAKLGKHRILIRISEAVYCYRDLSGRGMVTGPTRIARPGGTGSHSDDFIDHIP